MSAEGQSSDKLRSGVEYSMLSAAEWEVAEDQYMEADNYSYWIMRMTDLCYLLLQRWHEHLTNEGLEDQMLLLSPPEWSSPASLRSLFDGMKKHLV